MKIINYKSAHFAFKYGTVAQTGFEMSKPMKQLVIFGFLFMGILAFSCKSGTPKEDKKSGSPDESNSPTMAGSSKPAQMVASKANVSPRPNPKSRAKWVGGWIDSSGKEILVKDYMDAYPFFTKDFASACFRDKQKKLLHCNVIERNGKVGQTIPGPVIERLGKGKRSLYVIADPPRNPQNWGELDFVSTHSYKVGVIDGSFKTVIKPIYDDVFCIKGCRLLVGVKKDRDPKKTERTKGYCVPVEEHDYALFDRSGGQIITLVDKALVTGLDDDEALRKAVRIPLKSKVIPFLRKDKWGLVSLSGRQILKPGYTFLRVVNDKAILASYSNKAYDAQFGNKISGWLLLNHKGTPLDISFNNILAKDYYESNNLIAYSDTGCYLYQPDNNVVSIPDCQALKVMLDKKVVAFKRASKWGLADFAGKVLVPPTWDALGSSYNDGTILYPFPFSYFTEGLVIVANRDTSGGLKYGAINAKGEVKIPLEWDFVTIRDATIWVRKGKLWGTVDTTGKPVVPPKHDRLPSKNGKKDACSSQKLWCQKNAHRTVSPSLFFYRRRDSTFIYSTETEKKLYKEPVQLSSFVDKKNCDIKAHKKADIWPISLPYSKAGSLKALIGAKGLITAFKYSTLGCINHGLIPFTVEQKNRNAPIEDAKKKNSLAQGANSNTATSTLWPAPPMPKLESLLTALRKANKGKKDAKSILLKALPKLEKMKKITFPETGEARIIEIRSGKHLHGALVMVCATSADLCKVDCKRGLAIKEYQGDLGVKDIPAEIFAGKLHRVVFAPEFSVTRALWIHYDLGNGNECSKGKMKEYTNMVERALLLKMAKQRIVAYQTLTERNSEVSRKISWHKGKDGTWYMGVSTSNDYEPQAGQKTTCTVSLLIIPKKGYWKSIKGNRVNKLRETEPALKNLPKEGDGKCK